MLNDLIDRASEASKSLFQYTVVIDGKRYTDPVQYAQNATVRSLVRQGKLPPVAPEQEGEPGFWGQMGDFFRKALPFLPVVGEGLKASEAAAPAIEAFDKWVGKPIGAGIAAPQWMDVTNLADWARAASPFPIPVIPGSAEMQKYEQEVPGWLHPFYESVPYFAPVERIPSLLGKYAPKLAAKIAPGITSRMAKVVPEVAEGVAPRVAETVSTRMPEGLGVRGALEGTETAGVGIPKKPITPTVTTEARVAEAAIPEKPPIEPPKPPAIEPAPSVPLPETKGVLPELPTHGEILASGRFAPNRARKLAEKLGDYPVARQVLRRASPEALAREGSLEREIYMWAENAEKIDGLAQVVIARIRRLEGAFVVDDAGRITNIQPRAKDASRAISDVFEHPSRYKLTDQQKRVVEMANQITEAARLQREVRKIRWNVVIAGEEGRFFPRLVQKGKAVVTGRPSGPRAGETYSGAPFTKRRLFQEMEEGIQAGTLYEPDFASVLELYLKSHYRAIADKQLMEGVGKFGGRTAKQRLEAFQPALRRGLDEFVKDKRAIDRLAGWKNITGYIHRAIRGEKLPEHAISFVEARYPRLGEELRQALVIPKSQPRNQALRKVLATAKDEQLKAHDMFNRQKQLVSDAMKKYAEPLTEAQLLRLKVQGFNVPTQEALVTGAYAFRGKVYPKKIAEILDKYFADYTHGWIRAMEDANAVARFIRTGYDIGAPFIQGVPLLARRPDKWLQVTIKHLQVLKDPLVRQKWLDDNYAIIVEYLQNGGTISNAEFMEAIMGRAPLTSGLKKVPVIGKADIEASKRFGAAFNSFLDMGRIEYYKALKGMAAKRGAMPREVVAHVEKALGVTSSRAAGIGATQRAVEAILLFAPRYNRAMIGLLFDCMQGGFRGAEARKLLGYMLMAGLLVYTAKEYAEDQELTLDDYTDLFKNPSKALSVKIGDQYIGIGSIWVSAARVLADEVGTMLEDPTAFFEWSADNPIARAVRSRVSPVTGYGWDVATGASYIGERVDTPAKAAQHLITNQLVPFWLEGMIEEVQAGGNLAGVGIAGVSEVAGLRQYPLSSAQERRDLRDELAREYLASIGVTKDLGYYDLPYGEQKKITRNSPELQRLEKDVLTQKELRNAPNEVIDDWLRAYIKKWKKEELEKVATEIIEGKRKDSDWFFASSEIRDQAQGMYMAADLIANRLDAKGTADFDTWKEENTHPLDKLLDQYYSLPTDQRDAFLAGLPAEAASYIRYMTETDWMLDLGPNAYKVEQGRKSTSGSTGGTTPTSSGGFVQQRSAVPAGGNFMQQRVPVR